MIHVELSLATHYNMKFILRLGQKDYQTSSFRHVREDRIKTLNMYPSSPSDQLMFSIHVSAHSFR